jgi:hypothetical protein
MKKSLVIDLIVILSALAMPACQKSDNSVAPNGPGQSTPLPIAISGSYCTTWTQGTWSADGSSPINVTCQQADGSWTVMGGFPEAPPTPLDSVSYGEPSLIKAAGGDIYLGYSRWKMGQDKEHLVARYRSGSGWTPVTSVDVNSSGASLLPSYSQFGGKLFELNGTPYYFWTQSEKSLVSTPNGNVWNHVTVSSVFTRHPEAVVSATPGQVYLYYGQPNPTVYSFNGTAVTSLGGPTINAATEYTLYSSLVEWNGQLVLAYTSSDYPVVGNWQNEVDQIKVSFYTNGVWSVPMSGIQDKPGHDGVNPFLFTDSGQLFIMYGDYTTTGLPTEYDQLSFRFRVKRWDGSVWQPLSGESDVVNLSQRFEFFNDNGTVLVTVVQNADANNSQRRVLAWKNGQFGYSGGIVKYYPNSGFRMGFRPGAIIKL